MWICRETSATWWTYQTIRLMEVLRSRPLVTPRVWSWSTKRSTECWNLGLCLLTWHGVWLTTTTHKIRNTSKSWTAWWWALFCANWLFVKSLQPQWSFACLTTLFFIYVVHCIFIIVRKQLAWDEDTDWNPCSHKRSWARSLRVQGFDSRWRLTLVCYKIATKK